LIVTVLRFEARTIKHHNFEFTPSPSLTVATSLSTEPQLPLDWEICADRMSAATMIAVSVAYDERIEHINAATAQIR
jgi:hypothetical protein